MAMRYRSRTLRPSDPTDSRVVHNFPPGRPDRKYADGGWRYWVTDEPMGQRCHCGWLGGREHYGTVSWVDTDGQRHDGRTTW